MKRFVDFSLKISQPLTVTRALSLGLLSLCQGVMLARFLRPVLGIDPAIVTDALMLTVAIFGSFSLAALFMTSRLWIYIGAISLSGISYAFLASLANLWFQSDLVDNFLGLVLLFSACGYVLGIVLK
ncbi:Bax inhibitor 1-related [Babesia duncani]|uniref:Bax inhibitor 1-related n=1 Tax=Babesia duncani TaxID=323732 RepID=A0AAD9PMX3_9APIC|nr:Bax inhibitor 1-related [Babesia duncani]